MKIGIDARMYGKSFTGIGRYVSELTKNLFKIDNENEYVLFMNDPEFPEFEEQKYPRVRKVLVNAKHYSFQEQIKFLKILNKEKLDLMHFSHFNAPIFYRRPCVVTIHDLTLSFFPGKKMHSFFYRLGYYIAMKSILRKSAKIIAVSEYTKEDLHHIFRISLEKIEVIYEAASENFKKISEKEFKPILNKFNINKEYLLYTGVFREHKNLVGLLRAFALLKTKYGFSGNLVISGKEDPFYPEIRRTVKDFHLEDSVIFTGLVNENELNALYNGATIFVFPSLYEGFGLPILEAFNTGVPVCCSRTTSLPEIAGEGNACFFNPKDPADMADKIWELYTNKELQKILLERGYKRAKEFSWEKAALQTLKLYKEII